MCSLSSNYFNAPDADLILRTSDPATDFHVHKCILSLASPFFRHMLQLPQPSDSPKISPIDMSESTHVIETLLCLIYPMPNPAFDDLDQLVAVLHAAVKYDMQSAIDCLRKQLVAEKFVIHYPTRVYAIATRFDLEEEAMTASRYTLSMNLIGDDCPLSEDLKYITAFSYHRLLILHRKRAKAAQEEVSKAKVTCLQCNGGPYSAFSGPPKWWVDFERRAKEELSLRPTSCVIFSSVFLAKAAIAGCPKCPESILSSWSSLEKLKAKIDDLPATI